MASPSPAEDREVAYRRLIELGIALSAERNHNRLLETILLGAKELTVLPGRSVVVKDQAAYGCIIVQGHGTLGSFEAEASVLLRFGQPSADEYFVSEPAAKLTVMVSATL